MDNSKLKELLVAWGNYSADRKLASKIGAEENYSSYFNRLEEFNNIINCGKLAVGEVYFLYLRYVSGVTWDNMAYTLNYSRVQCFRLHNKILHKLQNILLNCGFII